MKLGSESRRQVGDNYEDFIVELLTDFGWKLVVNLQNKDSRQITPKPPTWSCRHSMCKLTVNQSSNSTDPCRMVLSMLAIRLGQALIAA